MHKYDNGPVKDKQLKPTALELLVDITSPTPMY